MKKKRFCTNCGHVLSFIDAKSFDNATGKPKQIPRCHNKDCQIGQYLACDHDFSWRGKCKKCGLFSTLNNDYNAAIWTILNS
jgi:hypothetical protein